MDKPKSTMDRLDQIITQLGALYAEADELIDRYVAEAREREAMTTPLGVSRAQTFPHN
jgi:hypothetical protein